MAPTSCSAAARLPDDDQGVVPALICEALSMPLVTNASAVEQVDSAFRITRVTPDGDEVVEVAGPAVVTVSKRAGRAALPDGGQEDRGARRMKPESIAPDGLSLADEDLRPRVVAQRQFVPTVQGSCEFIQGETPAELSEALVARLRQDGLIQ